MVSSLPGKRPRIFYGWYILAAGMGIQLFFGALMGGFGTLVVPLAAEFGWNKTVFAGAASLRQIESGLLGPLQGWLNDRYGSPALIRVGVIIWGLGFMALSQIDSIPGFYLAFLAAAIGASLGGAQTLNLPIINWFERRRSTALSILGTGFSLGGLLVPAIAASMAMFGWRPTLFGAGVAVIVVGFPLSFVIRDRPERYGWLPDGAPAPPERPSSSSRPVILTSSDFTVREALRTKAFWQVALGHAAALVVVSAVNLYFVAYLTDTFGLTLVEAAGYMTALNGVSIVAHLVGGIIGDRYSKTLVSGLCMFGHFSAILLLGTTQSVWTIWLFIFLHGLSWGIRGPLMTAIRAEHFGRSSFATINGIASLVTTLGTIGGPLIVGITTDAFGSYQIGFTVLSVISGFGSLLFFAAKKPRRLKVAS